MAPDPVGAGVLERGLAASWVRQIRWCGGTSHRIGGLRVALSAVPDQTQQVAVVDGDVTEPDAAVAAAEVLFARAGWAPALDLVAGVHPDLERVLEDRGYRIVVARPGMVAAVSPPSARVPVGVSIRSAEPADREAIVAVQGAAFGLDPVIADAMVPPASLADREAAVLVADDGGEVVGAVVVHLDGAVAGLVGTAVRPERQRRGVGAALVAEALGEGRRRGARAMWLQSTAAGDALYRRCGFREIGECQVWLRSPGS